MSKEQEELAKAYRENNAYIGFGIQIAISFFLFIFGGHWLDMYFNTKPILLIVGVFLALIAVSAIMMKLIRSAEKSKSPEKQK